MSAKPKAPHQKRPAGVRMTRGGLARRTAGCALCPREAAARFRTWDLCAMHAELLSVIAINAGQRRGAHKQRHPLPKEAE